jgi:Ni/Fe-hydrogenase subunit HybB-like protein
MIRKIRAFRPNSFSIWVAVLISLMVAGAAAALVVFARGLVVTNLTDLVPWGLWITIDISSIALSAGAFSFCAAVYLLGLKQYRPLARTATFIGLIGYTMAMLCLLLDIGRPDRFWHGFVFWNTHSVLWEVTMCVGLYFTVLVMESLPILARLEFLQTRYPKLASRMQATHHYAPYLAVAGLALSMLHQSSLGATYGVIISRPIWYRPGLAVLFITSALAGGLAMTMLASVLAARFNSRIHLKDNIIDRVMVFLGWLLVIYLYLRFWDAFAMTYTYQPGRTEGFEVLVGGPLSFNFWAGEIFLGIVLPMLILLNRRLRAQPILRLLALFCVVGGVVAYRWDTNMVGQLVVRGAFLSEGLVYYANYIPSLVEVVSAVGVISFGLLAFTLAVKYLKVVDHTSESVPV